MKDDATDTVELTVNWHGVTGNGADVRLNYYTGEAFPAGVKVTATAFTGGTGTPEMADAVAVSARSGLPISSPRSPTRKA